MTHAHITKTLTFNPVKEDMATPMRDEFNRFFAEIEAALTEISYNYAVCYV